MSHQKKLFPGITFLEYTLQLFTKLIIGRRRAVYYKKGEGSFVVTRLHLVHYIPDRYKMITELLTLQSI